MPCVGVYISTHPGSRSPSTEAPPSPHTLNSASSDADTDSTSGLKSVAGNSWVLACRHFIFSRPSQWIHFWCVTSQKKTQSRCKWGKSLSVRLRFSAMAAQELLSSGTVEVGFFNIWFISKVVAMCVYRHMLMRHVSFVVWRVVSFMTSGATLMAAR